MEGFVRQPCTIKMLTTCCEACGNGLEVPFIRSNLAPHVKDATTFRQATQQLDEWEKDHQCENRPALVSV